MRTSALLVLLLANFWLTSPLFPQDKDKAPPKPEDFAGAIQIAGSSGSLLELVIPQEVYAGLQRLDRGDMRVFDSSGIAVPFTFRPIVVQDHTPPSQSVPFFIWRSGQDHNLPSSRDIEINTGGGVVRIRDSAGAAAVGLPVYLVDFSALPQPPNALRIIVDHGGVYFNAAITIHTSSNLNNWQAFSQSQTISYYGDSGASRDQFGISPNARYALLSFDRPIPPLLEIEALFAPQVAAVEKWETRVLGEKSDDGRFAYYEVAGYYPMTAIDFRFPQPDSVNVYIRNRLNRSDERPRLQMQGRIYRFLSGDSVRTNDPFTDSRIASAGPHWELEALGETPFGTIPECYVIWQPSRLIFLARGTGPWTLAYGNAECPPVTQGGLTLSPDDTPIPATLTGESRYKSAPVQPDKPQKSPAWSQWILWGTLLLAAALLSVLAFFIARSMKNSDTAEGGE